MARYAAGTEVSIGRSRDELEALLTAHGATGFAFARDDTLARFQVIFRLADRMYRFTIPVPSLTDDVVARTPTGLRRSSAQAQAELQKETRRRWRSLLLLTKARLVAVADGIITMEEAFFADVILPDGATVAEWLGPQIETAYATAQMPAILQGPARREIEA